MRGVDNITLSPDTNNIELRQRSIRERSELRRQAGLSSNTRLQRQVRPAGVTVRLGS